jgi:predicted metal-binding membrane protein
VSRASAPVAPGAGPGGVLTGVSRRVALCVTIWLVCCAAVAWALTARQATEMAGMAAGLAQVGVAAPAVLTVPAFLAMWVGMTAAMMFPTAVPMVAAHRMATRRRAEGAAATVVFVIGYLTAWTVSGVLPLTALLGFRHLSAAAGNERWLPMTAGVCVAAAGAYQFTRWKSVCLRTCRSPLAFLMSHDFGGGARSALRSGVVYGGYCVGCCWALMGLLLVVGLMNLAWMVVLALVFLAEKCWRHGVGLTRVTGGGLIALGVLIVVDPGLLQTLTGSDASEMTQPGM